MSSGLLILKKGSILLKDQSTIETLNKLENASIFLIPSYKLLSKWSSKDKDHNPITGYILSLEDAITISALLILKSKYILWIRSAGKNGVSTGTIATCVLGYLRVFAHLIAEEIPASGPAPPSSRLAYH